MFSIDEAKQNRRRKKNSRRRGHKISNQLIQLYRVHVDKRTFQELFFFDLQSSRCYLLESVSIYKLLVEILEKTRQNCTICEITIRNGPVTCDDAQWIRIRNLEYWDSARFFSFILVIESLCHKNTSTCRKFNAVTMNRHVFCSSSSFFSWNLFELWLFYAWEKKVYSAGNELKCKFSSQIIIFS